MHRTEGANNAANLFNEGPPGTTVTDDWLNSVQEEISGVIEGSGATLLTAATDTRGQLLTALNTLYLGIDDGVGKNAIINGDFRVNQRRGDGTQYTAITTPANNDDTYLFDRWLLLSDGNDVVDVLQSPNAPTGGLGSIGLDVRTINKKFGILQVIEQKNCAHMIGGTVSLSFEAKVTDVTKIDNVKAMVVSWDGAADTVTSDIVSAWNAEDSTPTLVANWTAENTASNIGVTETWAKYTIPNISIDTASTKNIGVFIWSDGYCDAAAEVLYITKVQLEKNSIATEYEWRNITTELAMCQRRYCKSYNHVVIPGTSTNVGLRDINISDVANAGYSFSFNIPFPVTMADTPTVTLYDFAGNSGKVSMSSGDNIAGGTGREGQTGFRVNGTDAVATTDRLLRCHFTSEIEL